MGELKHSDLVIEGINKKVEQHTIDIRELGLKLPEQLQNDLSRLDYPYESIFHNINNDKLYDLGSSNGKIALQAGDGVLYIYRADLKEPTHDHARLQVCSLTLGANFAIEKITVNVAKSDFIGHLEAFGSGSTLIEKLKYIEFPEGFPSRPLDLSFFAASAEVLTETAKMFLKGKVE